MMYNAKQARIMALLERRYTRRLARVMGRATAANLSLLAETKMLQIRVLKTFNPSPYK